MGISLFRGKEHRMKRLILLLVTMSATMVVALMMVAMAVPVFARGAGDDEDKRHWTFIRRIANKEVDYDRSNTVKTLALWRNLASPRDLLMKRRDA